MEKKEAKVVKNIEKETNLFCSLSFKQKIGSEKKRKNICFLSFPEAKCMRNGFRFASFLFEAKNFESELAQPTLGVPSYTE